MDGASSDERYRRGEVVYLLGLTRDDALDDDVRFRDSFAAVIASLTIGDLGPSTHAEWDPVFTIARWREVHEVRGVVLERRTSRQRRLSALILDARSRGDTEEEVAEISGIHRLAARRRFGTLVDEILDELGGEARADGASSVISACMRCGQQPRARRREITRKRRGRAPAILRAEGTASVCWDCASDELRQVLVVPAIQAVA